MSVSTIVLGLIMAGAGWLIRHFAQPGPMAPAPTPAVPVNTSNPVLNMVLSEIMAALQAELQQAAKDMAGRILPPAAAPAPPAAPKP